MKMVAIFDQPSNCRHCPMMDTMMYACNLARREFDEARTLLIQKGCDGRPVWCPLKELPDTKQDWRQANTYETGWNDALGAIGGAK